MRLLIALLTVTQVAAIPAGIFQKRAECVFTVTATVTTTVTAGAATVTKTVKTNVFVMKTVTSSSKTSVTAPGVSSSKASSGAVFVQIPVTTQPLTTSSVAPSASVRSSTVSSGLAQILVPSSGADTKIPNTTGSINTSLQTLITSAAVISTSIASPTSTISVASSASKVSSLASSAIVMTSANIFQAIATDAPPSSINRRSDHPVPRLGIESQTSPLDTNKFYANLFLGTQSAPAFTLPYSVAWSKGSGNAKSWGLSISHIDANQRVYGPTNSVGGASYFINPVGIQSMIISALELGSSTVLSSSALTAFAMNLNMHPSSGAAAAITFPLVQGMVFTTGVFSGATPVLNSGVLFRTLVLNSSPKPGVTKYTIVLEDGKTWYLYATSLNGASITFQLISNTLVQATSNFNGYIQVAKAGGSASEALYDSASGAFPTDTTISGSADGAVGSYTLQFERGGITNATLAMFALPHHVESFDSVTAAGLTSVQLQSNTKGIATAVIGNSWTMVESEMPVTMGFAPWSPTLGSASSLSAAAKAAMADIAASEVSQDMMAQSNLDSFYYSGKALYKFAQIVYTINDLLGNKTLAQAGLTNLKAAFNVWVTNTNQYPLVYETAWGGAVSSASYTTGNSGVDFGNTYYNDHHFHYGYFVAAAAIIGHLDPTWLTDTNKAYVNTLVRDYANPSTADNYFPVSRAFDFYHGHSWAHGLYETFDGKDEESSSEDNMSLYALKMWGHTIGDKNMEARGNLQLAIVARSLQSYFLYESTNCIQDALILPNKVSGIMFENKIDHTTYFGTNIEYIQGIHMLPLIPSSTLTRTREFVTEEWNTWFSGGRAAAIAGGWKGVVMANLAIIDPVTSYNYFASSSFDVSTLDGGASRTWYMAFAAGLGGA